MDRKRALAQRGYLISTLAKWLHRGWSLERVIFHDQVIEPHWMAENGRLPQLRPLREWLSMGWAP